jgi:hypothetical protein
MGPIEVKYTSSDFRALAWHCPACRKRLLFFLFLPLLVILFREFVVSDYGGIDAFTVIGALVLGTLLSAVFLVVVPPLQVRAQRKAGFVEPYRISLLEAGIHAEHPRQDNLFRWSGLHDVAATDERVFLYTTPGCAVIVPKRSFESKSAFEQWCEEAGRRWSEAKAAT